MLWTLISLRAPPDAFWFKLLCGATPGRVQPARVSAIPGRNAPTCAVAMRLDTALIALVLRVANAGRLHPRHSGVASKVPRQPLTLDLRAWPQSLAAIRMTWPINTHDLAWKI